MPRPDSIAQWVKDGLMDSQAISNRFYSQIAPYTFAEQHLEIRKKFNSYATLFEAELHWDEAIFTNYLAENAQSSSMPLLKDAAPILFSMIVYLSTFPLTIHKKNSEPPTLTYEDQIRAMHWLQLGPNDGLDRTKSPADRRRYLFLSLADLSDDFEYNESEEIDISARKAFQVDEHARNWACVNYDEKGDEMYHDILDLISSYRMQYVEPPWGPYPKEDFVGLATHLTSPTRLRQLAISRARFKLLVKFLLAEYLNDGKVELSVDLGTIDSSAENIVNAFCYGTDADDVITWPKFEHNLSENTCSLFTSFSRAIEKLKKSPDETSYSDYDTYPPESLPTGHILNLATMSQFLFSFGSSMALEDPTLLFEYEGNKPSSTSLTIDHLMSLLESKPEDEWDTKILLISGTNVSNRETVIFGALTDCNDIDGHRSALFQLAPYHDTFRGTYGKKARWETETGGLSFGEQDKGFSMILVAGMDSMKVSQKITDKGTGTYCSTLWRGSWEMEVDVEKVELWE